MNQILVNMQGLFQRILNNKTVQLLLPLAFILVTTLAFLMIALWDVEFVWDIEVPIFYWSHRLEIIDIVYIVLDLGLIGLLMPLNSPINMALLTKLLYVILLITNLIYRILLVQIVSYGLVLFN